MTVSAPLATPLTSPTVSWGTYIDLETDFKPYVQFPDDQLDQDANLQLLIDSACWWVQDFCSRPFAPTTFYERFDGWTSWQGSYIMLPWAPVLQIISIVEYWGNSGPHPLAEQTPANQFGTGPSYGDADVYQLEPVTGVIRRAFPGLVLKPFFPGSRNIEVSWVAGYNPIPPHAKLATLELAAYWYRSTQEAPRMAAPRMGYGEEQPANELWPAIPSRVTALLEPYMRQGIG